MLKSILTSAVTGKELYNEKFYNGKPILVSQSCHSFLGVWKAATRSTAGITIIAEPLLNGSILLTDLIFTTDRVANATAIVRFTDGTNTIDILTGDANDAPVNLALSFGGRWQGWEKARLELITTSTVTATVACGYMKIKELHTLTYEAWDALR